MKARIDLLSIVTNHIEEMKHFYADIFGFAIMQDAGEYVEFENDGVRFAITTNAVMKKVTRHPAYDQSHAGQSLELAFRVGLPSDVDTIYQMFVQKGATAITPGADMPWGQRAAFFADPDGNIHEIFADIMPVKK